MWYALSAGNLVRTFFGGPRVDSVIEISNCPLERLSSDAAHVFVECSEDDWPVTPAGMRQPPAIQLEGESQESNEEGA